MDTIQMFFRSNSVLNHPEQLQQGQEAKNQLPVEAPTRTELADSTAAAPPRRRRGLGQSAVPAHPRRRAGRCAF